MCVGNVCPICGHRTPVTAVDSLEAPEGWYWQIGSEMDITYDNFGNMTFTPKKKLMQYWTHPYELPLPNTSLGWV